jgi:hypothetical protein
VAKRLFDLIVAAGAAAAVAAAAAWLALLVKLDSPGPVFFRQERVGRHGVPFRIHKFRTMVADAPSRGPPLTVGEDPRITRVGALAARTRLDELPQLIDVLAGDMSLVGPRPRCRTTWRTTRRPARARAVGAAGHHRPGVAGLTPTKPRCWPPRPTPSANTSTHPAAQAAVRRRLCRPRHAVDRPRRAAAQRRAAAARRPPVSDAAAARTRLAAHRLDLLARLRPHRQPLSLAVDAVVIALCWNVTYLFRLGFERWVSARPAYDGWVLLGVIALYLTAFAALRVPQSLWRFSGFGEVKRLTLACALAGVGGDRGDVAGPVQGAARRAGAAPGGLADGRVHRAHRLPHVL